MITIPVVPTILAHNKWLSKPILKLRHLAQPNAHVEIATCAYSGNLKNKKTPMNIVNN